MKPFNIIITISIIIITIGFYFIKNNIDNQQKTNQNPNQTTQSELPVDLSNYINYSEVNLKNSEKKGKTILFFAATTWCQSCYELEKEILSRQTEIPRNITILKVDFDNNKTMDQKWGITTQHTLVFLDQNGQEIKRWIGGGIDTLLQQIKETPS